MEGESTRQQRDFAEPGLVLVCRFQKERAANERPTREVSPGVGGREDVVGVLRVVRHLFDGDDRNLTEPLAWAQGANGLLLGRGVVSAQKELSTIVEPEGLNVVISNRQASNPRDRHHHRGLPVDTVDQVADTQLGNGHLALGGCNRRFGMGATAQPAHGWAGAVDRIRTGGPVESTGGRVAAELPRGATL